MTGLVVNDPAEWRGHELLTKDNWIYRLTQAEVDEIHAALAHAKSLGRNFDTLTAADFPLPTLGTRLKILQDELENGCGLYVLRGLPTDDRPRDDVRLIFWGLGQHIGTPVCQTYSGEYLGDVRQFGEQAGRLYNTNIAGGFHGDTVDVVALCVVRTAKAGGRSLIASTVAIHNELARTRPDLLEALYQPYTWLSTTPDEYLNGRSRTFQQPMFSRVGDKFSSLWLPVLVRRAQDLPGVEPMTALQKEALDMVDAMANSPEFILDMMFEPGDMQFVNNHVLVHGRTAFEDYEEPDRKRHLLRLWLSMANSRPLDPAMARTWGSIEAGAVRGGIGAEAGKRVYQSFAAMPT